MAKFTTWFFQRQGDPDLPLPKDVADELAERVLKDLPKLLRPRITHRFGIPEVEDLVHNEFLATLERLRDTQVSLPNRVTNKTTMLWWMLSRIKKHFHRNYLKPGRKLDHGLSSAPEQSSEAAAVGGPRSASDSDFAWYSAKMVTSMSEMQEALALAKRDLARWRGEYWLNVFELVFCDGLTQAEVAKQLNAVPGTINRGLAQGRFCLARHLDVSQEELNEEFGEARVKEWSEALDQLGK